MTLRVSVVSVSGGSGVSGQVVLSNYNGTTIKFWAPGEVCDRYRAMAVAREWVYLTLP